MAETGESINPGGSRGEEVENEDNFSRVSPARLETPANCIADFCLIPIGTPTASVSKQIADVQRLMQTCGLNYSMHSAGTTVEGSWDDVMRVIGRAHMMLHEKGIVRIQTDIRVGSRTDKKQHHSEKVTAVEKLLAMDRKYEDSEK